jgi:hypothetical protein
VQTKPVNLKGLSRYSASKDGRVFLLERELKPICPDPLTIQFAMTPSRHKLPKPIPLADIYRATFGIPTPNSVTARIRRLDSRP